MLYKLLGKMVWRVLRLVLRRKLRSVPPSRWLALGVGAAGPVLERRRRRQEARAGT